jgi:hypothetical protein
MKEKTVDGVNFVAESAETAKEKVKDGARYVYGKAA